MRCEGDGDGREALGDEVAEASVRVGLRVASAMNEIERSHCRSSLIKQCSNTIKQDFENNPIACLN